jgi:hypothetical protein
MFNSGPHHVPHIAATGRLFIARAAAKAAASSLTPNDAVFN